VEGFGTTGRPKEGSAVLLVGEPDQTHPALAVLKALHEIPLTVSEASSAEFDSLKRAADVVMIFFGPDEDASLSLVHKESGCEPRPVIFALLHEQSATLTRRALRAGADEVLFLPLAPAEVVRPLLKVSEALRRRRQVSGGKIFSIASLGGGVGVTTLCSNLGFALLGEGDVRVVLIDLDLQEGGLGALFGVNSERGILALARMGHKPDSIGLEAALTRHESGLYVLGAPARIEDSDEITDITVGNLLELVRELFDYILIDSGGHIDEKSLAAWERSQEVLYVLDQSIAAVNRAGRFLNLFRRLGIDDLEPKIVLNRYQPGHPISESQIETSLECPIYEFIPRDDRVMEKAVATGRMAAQVAPSSAAVRACEQLARRLTADGEYEMEPRTRPGWRLVSRLLGTLGARA
jgi:pilus assembly protein CpaE